MVAVVGNEPTGTNPNPGTFGPGGSGGGGGDEDNGTKGCTQPGVTQHQHKQIMELLVEMEDIWCQSLVVVEVVARMKLLPVPLCPPQTVEMVDLE